MKSPITASEPGRPTDAARLKVTQLAPQTPLDEVFSLSCQLVADALGVERVGVWLFAEDKKILRCARLFERSQGEFSAGTVLRIDDFPKYFTSISLRKSVPAEIATTDPRTAELAVAYLMPLGITSLLDAGIFTESDLVGVLCVEHVGPLREWTTEARDFVASMADLIALRIQSAESQDLKRAFRTQRERIVALEKAAALEQMAAGVAHDFKNLLGVIEGYSDLLSKRNDLPKDVRKQCTEMLSAAELGTALVRELMDFAKPTDKSPTVLNPADTISELLPVVRAAVGQKHEIRFVRPDAVGQILLNRTQFGRILMNLSTNARDAMPEGGTITIGVRSVRLAGSTGTSGHFIMLEVSDHGNGMDEATRKRAFEPFFTTRAKGTGLGLAIVHRIVDRAGGTIRIESTPGDGTIFRVFFPRVGSSSGGTTEFAIPQEFLAVNVA